MPLDLQCLGSVKIESSSSAKGPHRHFTLHCKVSLFRADVKLFSTEVIDFEQDVILIMPRASMTLRLLFHPYSDFRLTDVYDKAAHDIMA